MYIYIYIRKGYWNGKDVCLKREEGMLWVKNRGGK